MLAELFAGSGANFFCTAVSSVSKICVWGANSPRLLNTLPLNCYINSQKKSILVGHLVYKSCTHFYTER